jgi:hypothetical protein
MTPRQHKEFLLKQESEAAEKAKQWHCLLFSNGKKLKTALAEMDDWRLDAGDVPLIIKLIENPKYDIGILPGAVSLFSHDCIHILLGRGILPKDEAFVIGFTMGSTKKMNWFREKLFLFISRWLYPEGYKFYEEERRIFELALIAGKRCPYDLTKIDFKKLLNKSMTSIRKKIEVDTKFIKILYFLEKKMCPDSLESQRLL